MEVSACGAGTTPLRIDRDLTPSKALLHFAVQILRNSEAGRVSGSHQRIVQQAARIDRHYVQRAARAVMEARAAPARFHAAEVRQHILIPPAFAAQPPPTVEIARMPAHVEHTVDGGATA